MSTPSSSAAQSSVVVSSIEPGLGGLVCMGPASLVDHCVTKRTMTVYTQSGTLSAAEILDGDIVVNSVSDVTLTMPEVADIAAELASRGVSVAIGRSFCFEVHTDGLGKAAAIIAPSTTITLLNGGANLPFASTRTFTAILRVLFVSMSACVVHAISGL